MLPVSNPARDIRDNQDEVDQLLAAVSLLLNAVGVFHRPLAPGAPHLNLNGTDSERVFVKISRHDEPHDRAHLELAGAVWAREHSIPTPVPLLSKVVTVPDLIGASRAVTVWAFSPDHPAPPLECQIAEVVQVASRIHATPPPPAAPALDLSFFHTRIRQRLTGLHTSEADLIRAAADTTMNTITHRLASLKRPSPVWIHGDLHARNLHWTVEETPIVLDWESNVTGPAEWEWAQILRSIFLQHPDVPLGVRSQVADAALHDIASSGAHLDRELVHAIALFRTASSASHLLIHGHQPADLARDFDHLNPGSDLAVAFRTICR